MKSKPLLKAVSGMENLQKKLALWTNSEGLRMQQNGLQTKPSLEEISS